MDVLEMDSRGKTRKPEDFGYPEIYNILKKRYRLRFLKAFKLKQI